MSVSEYIPISIQEFITGVVAPTDLYVRLGPDKFICVTKKGQKTQYNQLATYKEKSVDYLWVHYEQYPLLKHNNVAIAGIVIGKDKFSPPQKARFVSQAAHSVFNELEHMGISMSSFNSAKQVTEVTCSMVEAHNDLLTLIESFKACSDEMVRLSLATSAISVVIAQEIGWENKQTLEKLALGGLLADIGLKSLPPEILKKPRAQMTYDEAQAYESHPFKGMEMAHSLGVVPDDVVSIIYEHHENAIGQGYPRRIRDVKIHPLARVVALAQTFVGLVPPNVNAPIAKSPRDAIMYIEHTMGQPFNKEAFKALKRLMGDEKIKIA